MENNSHSIRVHMPRGAFHPQGAYASRPPFLGEWSPERFIHWAEKIGPETAQIIQMELNSKQHPEQAYRACLGILGFARKYPTIRLEAVCHYAIANDIHSDRGIKNILVNQIDRLSNSEGETQPSLLPPHSNIHGNVFLSHSLNTFSPKHG